MKFYHYQPLVQFFAIQVEHHLGRDRSLLSLVEQTVAPHPHPEINKNNTGYVLVGKEKWRKGYDCANVIAWIDKEFFVL